MPELIRPGRPNLSAREAERLVLELFNWTVKAHSLPSDRDQNFRVDEAGGKKAVLKISNSEENPGFLDCQAAVLSLLATSGIPVPTILGQSEVTLGDFRHQVRLVSWLEGRPLAKVNPITADLEEKLGALLGSADALLLGFEHDAAPTNFVWDLANAVQTIGDRIHLLAGEERSIVEAVVELYGSEVSPIWEQLPKAVIHHDANDYNVLVGPPHEDGCEITGLLDFGDIVYSARVCNPAVAAAYLALHRGDPVDAMCSVAKGYASKNGLSEPEVGAFFALVCARLAVSVCMSAAQKTVEPENEYLSISELDAWACLRRLKQVHPRLAHYRLRAAVGLEPVPSKKAFESWLVQSGRRFEPVIRPAKVGAKPTIMDFSAASLEFDPVALTVPGTAAETVWKRIGDGVGIGRWNEPRLAYTGSQYETTSGERRTVHIGVDLFRPEGTPVQTPLDGLVHSFCAHHAEFDYGGCIVLEHRPKDGPVFWTLFGHLSHPSVAGVQKGQLVHAGEVFAHLGSFEENGGWVPHLHFQIVLDLLDLEGTFPGVAAASLRDVWTSLSPSPARMLGLPTETDTPPSVAIIDLLQQRSARLGSALSISYRKPLHIVRGWQQVLFDADGHAFLDAVNNVPHVGHSNPRVVEALTRQMRTLTTNTRYLHETVLEYSRRLSATMPEGLEVCYFVNSGSEANDLAIRLARAYTRRQDIMVLDGAYHGNLTTLIGISPYKFNGRGGDGKPAGTHVVSMPDPYRGAFRGMSLETGHKYAEEVEKVAGENAIAAFIAESVPGCGGQIVPPPGYFLRAAEAVRKAGGLFIADEVQIGMGRAGESFWGFQLGNRSSLGTGTESSPLIPDIVVLGKPIGNGHPLGAVVTTRAISDAFNNGMEYFNTFGGNPASCAVGLAVLDEIEEKHLQKNAFEVGNHLLKGLASLAPHHPIIGDVRGVGLFIGVELVRHPVDLEPADHEATYVANRMRDNGILISTDGPFHNVLKIKPPMVFNMENADQLISTLDRILSEDFVTAKLRS
ncbi:MAG: aminotransferase class III-fold pyridoxal phosphate-dependent enzyme [Bacteroidetes bacterium]|nr:aminotransferase class III-fold pyridoxal phosphate-dependent enzyme [Bacteroidota bacterium]